MTWPWEWDWNWFLFLGYCIALFFTGMLCYAIGLPGVFAIVLAAVVGACAGSWEWFEAHEGNNDY